MININPLVEKENDKLRYLVVARFAYDFWEYHIFQMLYNSFTFSRWKLFTFLILVISKKNLKIIFHCLNWSVITLLHWILFFNNILLTEYCSFYIISISLITYQFLDNGEINHKARVLQPNKINNYGIHPYLLIHHELLCLRLLLINFSVRSFDDLFWFNGLSISTFAEVECYKVLIDNEKQFYDCIDEAIQSYWQNNDLD